MSWQGHFDRKGEMWANAAFSPLGICENLLHWEPKLKQALAQSGALNHQLSTTTALAFGGPFFHFWRLQCLSHWCDQQMCTESEPWQSRDCYLQGPFLKSAYISYSVLETWCVAGMKLASFVVNISAVPFITSGEIAHIFPG